MDVPEGGGTHLLKLLGMCATQWVTFSPKILRHKFHFGQKNPLKRIPFHKNCEKLVKSSIFDVEKPVEIGPDLQTFWKKNQISRFFFFFFEGEILKYANG